MNTKKLLVSLIAAATVACTMGLTASATADTWDGTADTVWYTDAAAGTTEFTIDTAEELAGLAELVNAGDSFSGKTITLAESLDLAGYNWTPIGTEATPFSGVFDGGKDEDIKISNLYIENTNPEKNKNYGLFGTIYRATLQNVYLDNVDITVTGKTGHNYYTGGLVGFANSYPEIKDSTKLLNSTVTGNLTVSGRGCGGVVGYAYATTKLDGLTFGDAASEKSSFSIDAVKRDLGYGGIVGYTYYVSAFNNLHMVNAEVNGSTLTAGLIGWYNNDGVSCNITNCSVTDSEINGANGTGGIVGLYNSPVSISSTTVEDTEINGIEQQSGVFVGFYDTGTINPNDIIIDETCESTGNTGTASETIGIAYAAEINGKYYTTIAEAVKFAAESATESTPVTIQFAKGTFTESITLPANLSYVTFKGADNHGTILKNISVGQTGGMNDKKTNLTFDGIVFENSNINLTAIYDNTKIENMTVNNCKFLNVEGKAAVSINTNSKPNLVGFTFTNNVIDGVTGGSFSGLVLRAAPTGDIVITGNNISNVAWNAVQLVNLTADANVTIADNTMSSGASEGVLNIYNAKCGITLADNTINTVEGQNAISGFAPVAKIGDKHYTTLADAIAAAEAGDTITMIADAALASANIKKDIVIDLNKNILTVEAEGIMDSASGAQAAIQAWADVTFKNGTVNVSSEAKISNGIFYVANKAGSALTFDNVTLNAENTNGTDLIVTCSVGELEIIDSIVNAKGVSKLINGGDTGSAVITGTEINLSDSERAMVNVALTATDSDFVIKNLSDNAFRNVSGTIHNTDIDANGYENGLKNDAGLNLVISGDSNITMTGATDGAYDIVLGDGAKVEIKDEAVVNVDKTKTAENGGVEGNIISKAEIVYIQFKKTDLDDAGNDNDELKDVYDLVLLGYDSETINELASADFTFDFAPTPVKGGKMAYSVIGAKGVTVSRLGESDRYMFNYNGIDKYEETGKAICIATVEVSGYGTYYLGMANEDTNAVYATEIRDNIVSGYEPCADTLVINEDMVKDDGMVGAITGAEILVPTRELTINIDFPNEAITNNKVAYQQMTVTVSGGDLEEDLVIKLGDVAEITDLEKFIAKKSEDKAVTAVASKDAYDITITDLLTLSIAYNVTVEGAGYRTARYTVTMTEDKTLNFWNNVKNNEVKVEEGKDSSAKTVTYLAGDIVKDNDINIYDLSAVVSYFGEEGLSASKHPEYAKYDLNRDGKIDSKDVAYVLVSWGK